MQNSDFTTVYNIFKNKIDALEARLEATEVELLSINSVVDFFIDTTPGYEDYLKGDWREEEEEDEQKTIKKQLPPKLVPIHLDIMGLDFSDNIRNRKKKKRGRK